VAKASWLRMSATSNCLPHPASIVDINKVIEQLICCSLAYSALNSYTHTTWLRFGGSGSLVES
jgi:hypothetical protein